MNTGTSESYTAHVGEETLPQDLAFLNDLDDFQVADHDPDPRGYTVVGADNAVIGKVEDLAVSPGMVKAFFALVRTGEWLGNAYLMVPMRPIRLEPDTRRAFIPVTREQCRLAPAYVPGMADYDRHDNYWSGLGAGAV